MATMDVYPCASGERISRARCDEKILHQDIISAILERLPVKSLARFKCVSKNWCAMIRSPSFIKRFIVKQQGGPGVLISWKYSPLLNKGLIRFRYPQLSEFDAACSDISVPFMPNYLSSFPDELQRFLDKINLIGPCDGLIGIVFGGNVSLCNPSLMEYKELPYCNIDPRDDLADEDPFPEWRYRTFLRGQGIGRACDGDYKLVLIWQIIDEFAHEDRMKAYVYNLSTTANAWTETEPRPYGVPDGSPQVFINGTCHWHAFDDPFSEDEFKILSLELRSEEFIEIEYPDDCSSTPYLMVLNQCLAFVQLNLQGRIEVWVMEDYGDEESWNRHFVVGPYVAIYPLVIWENDEWLLAKRKGYNGQLVSCSLENTEMKTFGINLDVDNSRIVTYDDASSVSLDEVMKSVAMIKLG